MNALLRFLFGLEPGEVPPGGVTSFELAGMPSGFWAAAALVIGVGSIALVVLIYRRESELAAGKRAVLTGLRLLALAVVMLVLLNPRLVVVLEARRLAQTLLLVDGSGSMGFRDRYEGAERAAVQAASGLDPASGQGSGAPTRADLVAAALERSDLVGKLGKTNRPRPYVFDEGLAAQEPAQLAAAVRASPRAEKSTFLGSAIRAALDASRADPVAAVVLISDGKSNGGDALAGAAGDLESRGIPLHVLGVGRIDLPRNIAVVEVNAPEVAETNLPLRIRVRVRATGFPGDAEVKLQRKRSGEKEYETVGQETVKLGAFESEAVVNLTDVPGRDGRYRYLASVTQGEGEETYRDNLRYAEVVVAGEKCRLLLVAGGPSREYRFLTRFFLRDPGIQVSAWLQSADRQSPQDGDLVLRALPATEEALRPYDVVVLLDPDPSALPEKFVSALERFVSELGGGVAFLAGQHYTRELSRSPLGERLRAILPVELGPDPPEEHPRSFRPELTPAGAMHTLCQLKGSGEENRRLWSVLPRFYFRFPIDSIKPAATALLRSGESVVAAVHQAGAGRVLFVATDDLWRWREYREEIHEQFWSGAARFLALGKRIAGTRQMTINTDRERYRIGEEGRIEAHVLDGAHQPLSAPNVIAALERMESPAAGDGEEGSSTEEVPFRTEVTLSAVPSRPGWFRGRMKFETPGAYRLTLKDLGAEGLPASFTVARPSSETEDPAPDFAALAELAKRCGGTFGPLSDIGEVAARIPDRTVVEVLGRKTTTVWDSAVLLFLFSGALIVEWSLRKKWRLT